jgi:hypothetical protein
MAAESVETLDAALEPCRSVAEGFITSEATRLEEMPE